MITFALSALALGIAVVGFWRNRRFGVALAVLALISADTRVYVGLHHPIDVIANMVIATVITSAVFAVLKYVARKAVI